MRQRHTIDAWGTKLYFDCEGESFDSVAALAEISSFVALVDDLFSTYKPDSVVSQIRTGRLQISDAPADVIEVAHLCVVARDLTDGAFEVKLKNTGGPSGGLIFALGLTELLTPEDLLQGRKIAASGTVSKVGKVGPIGGITEKIIAAKKAGAELLFMAKENCEDLPTDVSGISVVAVTTLQEALDHLQKPISSSSPRVSGCTNLGA